MSPREAGETPALPGGDSGPRQEHDGAARSQRGRTSRVVGGIMYDKEISRREFLARSVAGLSLTSLPAWYAREAIAAEQERGAGQPARVRANERINIACIGTGGSRGVFRQGLGDTRAMAGQPGVQVVAVC